MKNLLLVTLILSFPAFAESSLEEIPKQWDEIQSKVSKVGEVQGGRCHQVGQDQGESLDKGIGLQQRARTGGVLDQARVKDKLVIASILNTQEARDEFVKYALRVGEKQANEDLYALYDLLVKGQLQNSELAKMVELIGGADKVRQEVLPLLLKDTASIFKQMNANYDEAVTQKVDPVTTTLFVITVTSKIASATKDVLKHEYESSLEEAIRTNNLEKLNHARKVGKLYLVSSALSIGIKSIDIIGGIRSLGELIVEAIRGAFTGGLSMPMSQTQQDKVIAEAEEKIQAELKRERDANYQREMAEAQRAQEREIGRHMEHPETYRDYNPGSETGRTC
ncbi:MAG: hypothetical protein COW00_05225 [Bdellovibrio sp. CG12_big_fil_rev_8_21_14_0_65_39_13]|nr:MAG: hypothetical protein COW78_13430 [Bdellovibrio sp. CG22_combo_CG10-13_8_21_14_all_39_27]PIQ61211.1 MAG: hypothetical protein COW00_05225 [Bdellovibrio sp. CG12_big_fil_rev_8_21_14_0_65_39_13]PIR34880.1 MAG: hypothetical protein COV37_11500 [Bdellovibrio sp. CG11_big_fil_rev_8_21_14_0_20_39_38]